ncbi:MAG TPA: LysR family transcriptional regulator [Candidatus Anaerofilum faecale]|nr:LysR family transcriptional regulator [Candidatus Anaerofilum faecale]
MEIRVLKYFLLVAREENITKAANLLHLTQPTLSRQLMQLEEELGVQLFRRSKHRIILTEEGMLLRRRAEEIVALADKTKDDLQRREEQLSGTVAVGSGELQSSRFLAQLLTAFQEKNPLVSFAIYSGNSDNIKERIERGLLDVGLLQEPVDITKYRFVRTPGREQWGVLVREDSELASRERVGPADLATVPLILPERETVQNELLNWFGPYAERLYVTATGNLLYNLASLARDCGSGVLTLNLDCTYPGLRFVPLDPVLESNTVLVWKKAQTFSAAAAAFLTFSEKYISEYNIWSF